MNTELHFSLDSVIAFREQYNTSEPSLSALGLLSEWSGVSGLSLSGREDWLEVVLPTAQRWSEELNIKVNLCFSPDVDLRRLSYEYRLDRVTLIPARWIGPSVVGGLDAYHLTDELRTTIRQLREADVEVAALIEPKVDLIKRLQRLDVDTVIFSTHTITSSSAGDARRAHFSQLMDAVAIAARLGLRIGVRGGINLSAAEQLSRIAKVTEIHVGQSLSARAMLRGLERGVTDFKDALTRGRQSLL